jgi:hypothetical protein
VLRDTFIDKAFVSLHLDESHASLLSMVRNWSVAKTVPQYRNTRDKPSIYYLYCDLLSISSVVTSSKGRQSVLRLIDYSQQQFKTNQYRSVGCMLIVLTVLNMNSTDKYSHTGLLVCLFFKLLQQANSSSFCHRISCLSRCPISSVSLNLRLFTS